MIRGLDTVSGSFNVLTQKQKNLATNAANTMTPGYKSQQLMTSTTEQTEVHNYTRGPESNRRRDVGSIVFSNQLDEAVRNFSSGGLQLTDHKTDLAVNGDAFFTVQNGAGELLYTKNGNFSVNAEGQLITQEGYLVMGIEQNGGMSPIMVGTDVEEAFTVSNNGFVYTNDRNVPQFLYMTQFEDPTGLTSAGGTLFQGDGGVPAGNGFTIEQGYVESSNVSMVDVMSDMLQISREFEANQKVLQSADETLRRATQEVGRT
ncbi:flagellar hook-basal body protein [Alkalibacterium pelagium]|uniref:Flagellar basal-body rod protein FlgG n=1 Tax=Alkalibacterium pelagium TaxID=426702 RepID=A0A1H7KUJ8_9LACT|nr:flagellar hook-basal body complex protein [Alkalibacterium pelagium]GEN50637.1 flagellar basal body protein [Alkalibacterium pelagium]SEK89735.1 flagellar basal-body rod protein FlgG [Alkalibacterium pelagium]